MSALLEVTDLHAEIEGKAILRGLSLKIQAGEVHALMGPNGSGKSTFSNILMGHPSYKVTSGKIVYKGTDITELSAEDKPRCSTSTSGRSAICGQGGYCPFPLLAPLSLGP